MRFLNLYVCDNNLIEFFNSNPALGKHKGSTNLKNFAIIEINFNEFKCQQTVAFQKTNINDTFFEIYAIPEYIIGLTLKRIEFQLKPYSFLKKYYFTDKNGENCLIYIADDKFIKKLSGTGKLIDDWRNYKTHEEKSKKDEIKKKKEKKLSREQEINKEIVNLLKRHQLKGDVNEE